MVNDPPADGVGAEQAEAAQAQSVSEQLASMTLILSNLVAQQAQQAQAQTHTMIPAPQRADEFRENFKATFPKFSGSKVSSHEARMWLKRVDNFFEISAVKTDSYRFMFMFNHLEQGTPFALWYQNNVDGIIDTWSAFQAAFTEKYSSSVADKYSLLNQWRAMNQNRRTAEQYGAALQDLFTQINLASPGELSDSNLLYHFMVTCRHEQLLMLEVAKLPVDEPMSFDTAVSIAQQTEQATRNATTRTQPPARLNGMGDGRGRGDRHNRRSQRGRGNGRGRGRSNATQRAATAHDVCYACGQRGHFSRDCTAGNA